MQEYEIIVKNKGKLVLQGRIMVSKEYLDDTIVKVLERHHLKPSSRVKVKPVGR